MFDVDSGRHRDSELDFESSVTTEKIVRMSVVNKRRQASADEFTLLWSVELKMHDVKWRTIVRLGIPVYSDYAIAAFFAYFAKMRISHIFPHIMAFSKFRIFIYVFGIFIYA